MKQQINLYLPEFRKVKDPLTFERLVSISLAVLAVLFLVSVYEFWRSSSLGNKLQELDAQRLALQSRTEATLEEITSRSTDAELVKTVDELEEGLSGKRVLMEFLAGREEGNTRGFSGYLRELSVFHLEGLRLTHILLDQGGESVTLEGEVLKADLVTRYLQALNSGSSFMGKSFASLSIREKEEETNVMLFKVSSEDVK